jgi:hypothetical protein
VYYGPNIDLTKLSRLRPVLELLPHLAGSCLPHAPIQCGRKDVFLSMNGPALEEMIAGVGYGLLCGLHVGFVCVRMPLLPRLGNDTIGLMAVLRG